MSARWTEEELADYESRRMQQRTRKPKTRVPSRVEATTDKVDRPLKFKNKRTEVDGIVFHSKREARRYQDLKLCQQAGVITDLALQVNYPLVVNGIKIAAYCSDFNYMKGGQQVVEDVKSDFTRKLMWYRMKKKLMLALYGIEILET